MARSNQEGANRIYELHHEWLSKVLPKGDSLLTPGLPIWTNELLDELEVRFIGQPDLTSGKSYLDKVRGQLAGASPQCVQLVAEVHVIHYLMIWNGTISAKKKVSDLNAILSWMPEPPAVPAEVAAAMSPGIAHPGIAAMTRRDTQIAWLIRFGRGWRGLSDSEQQQCIADPWKLRDLVESVYAEGSSSARLSLLHLAHPDTFDPIVAAPIKELIVRRFSDSGETEDLDRTLLELRRTMSPRLGEGFDWYDEDPFRRWSKDSKRWPALMKWVMRIRSAPDFEVEERDYKVELADRLAAVRQALLSGDAPWLPQLKNVFQASSNNLTQWRAHSAFIEWAVANRDAAEEALRVIWDIERDPIQRLGAFLDQLPTSAPLGTKGSRLNIGSFLLMADNPQQHPPTTISPIRKAWRLAGWGREDTETNAAELYRRGLLLFDELVHDSTGWDEPLADRLDAQGAVWAVSKLRDNRFDWPADVWEEFVAWRQSNPDDGQEDDLDETGLDEGRDEDEASSNAALVDHIAMAAEDLSIDREVLDEIVELLDDKGQVVLYGPPGTGKTVLAKRLAKAIAGDDERDDDAKARHAIVQFHPATSYEDFFEGLRPRVTEAGQVTYERVDGPLVDMVERAKADPGNHYVLVVDEINRANLPKVFGELLFLLEHRDEAVRTLYRPTSPFSLPENLWFIGTMNTADRSVALIDAAMRRRFHFVPFFPHEGPMKDLLRRWLEKYDGRVGVADFLDAVNNELIEIVGEHLLVGPSHFMRTDLSDQALARIWTYNVAPLIEEQIWGDRDEMARWKWEAVRERFATALSGTGDANRAAPDGSERASPEAAPGAD